MDYTKLIIKDEAFTKEKFGLKRDHNGVLMTHPRPTQLVPYYDFDDYISHRSEKTNVVTRIYNAVKHIMFSIKLKSIHNHKPQVKSVLDYGCGTGEFVNFLNTRGIKAEGFEPTLSAFKKASRKNIKVYNSMNKIIKTYDVITMFHVLEHVEDYTKTLKFLKTRLNPNGLLLIAVPNHKSYDATFYKEKWAAWDVPRHLWHFSKTDIRNLVKKNYLELIQIKPLPFDAFYISMVSEAYKGNPKAFGIWRGLLSNLNAIKTKEYSSHLFVIKSII